MWEWVESVAGAIEPHANLIAAMAAVATAAVAIAALAGTARDSRERSRPLVFAMFREAEHSDSSFDLVIRNYGTSAARELKVEFDPPLDRAAREDELTDFVAKRYEGSIPLLPPGSELTNTWWGGGMYAGEPELVNRLNTPDDVLVKITYRGNRIRRYSDEFELHADVIKLRTYTVSSTSMPGRMKSIAESLKIVASELKSTNRMLKAIDGKLPVESHSEIGHRSASSGRKSKLVEFVAHLRRR